MEREESCHICGRFAGFESNPEGEHCDRCDRWVCIKCVNWGATSEKETVCTICVPNPI